MHADQIDVGPELARALVDEQFPEWAGLALRRVESTGTSHTMYRLGDEMVVRFPFKEKNANQVDIEQEWLPRIAEHISLAMPVPLGAGRPDDRYPLQWSVYPWIEGESVDNAPLADPVHAATRVASFVHELRQAETPGAPGPSEHNYGRGEPVRVRDEIVRAKLDQLWGIYDVPDILAAWDETLAASDWEGPPQWLHGDLQPGNLLVDDAGNLTAVIDWGCAAVGDPAGDLLPAWTTFTGDARATFLEAMDPDPDSRLRGRGWALFMGVSGFAYYLETNPRFSALCKHIMDEVLEDFRHG